MLTVSYDLLTMILVSFRECSLSSHLPGQVLLMIGRPLPQRYVYLSIALWQVTDARSSRAQEQYTSCTSCGNLNDHGFLKGLTELLNVCVSVLFILNVLHLVFSATAVSMIDLSRAS